MRLRRIWVKTEYARGSALRVKTTDEFDAILDYWGAEGYCEGLAHREGKSSLTLIYDGEDEWVTDARKVKAW